MELVITPEIEHLIQRKLATGRYTSAEHIVAEALKSTIVADEQRGAALDALRHMVDDCGTESLAAREWLRHSHADMRRN